MKRNGTLLLALFLGIVFASHCEATVYNSDGSAANVQALQDAASDGDTIAIPAGTFTWSTPVTISKAIKLQGPGSGRIIGDTKSFVTIGTGSKTFTTTREIAGIAVGQTLRIAKMPNYAGYAANARENYMEGTVTSYSGTTLVMNITSTGGSGTWTFWWIATQPSTTILNNYNNGAGNNNGATPLIGLQENPNGPAELSGVQFKHLPASNSAFIGITATTFLSNIKALVHNCWFQTGDTASAAIYAGTNHGLIWNCSFDNSLWSANVEGIQVKISANADNGSWSTNSTMGMDDTNGTTNFYVEDCDFHAYLTAMDFDDNSRAVVRYNSIDNCSMGNHGADTSNIGVRHFELYDNELIFDNFGSNCEPQQDVQWFFWVRGGTGVITDNILPSITSQCGGTKSNIPLSVLNTRRDSGPYCCWTTYPAPHQPGQGYGNGAVLHSFSDSPCAAGDFSYYIFAEPIYIWNNTGTAGNSTALNEDTTDQCSNNQHVADYIQEGRDYIIGLKPGYTKFTYPHPLRGASPAPTPTATPSSTATPISTPTPSATATVTPTATATPTSTPMATPPAVPPAATATPTPSATFRPTPTPTPTATATPRATATPTPTPHGHGHGHN